MGLNYGPREQAQALRQRLRALRPRPLVVVEGSSDRAMMSHILTESVHVQYLRGKSSIMPIVEELSREFPNQVLFLVDCDDSVEDDHKGLRSLVITQYRDLDADIVLALDSWTRVSAEFYAGVGGGSMIARSRGSAVLNDCASVSIALTKVRYAARSQGAKIRVFRPNNNRKGAFRPTDFPQESARWLNAPGDIDVVVESLRRCLGWSEEESDGVRRKAKQSLDGCRHSETLCDACERHRLVNGHDLIELLGLALTRDVGCQHDLESLYAQFRIGADLARCRDWPVARRIAAWERSGGAQVLRPELSA